MQLAHGFSVPVRPDVAWSTLLDVRRTASCLPGASIESISGDDILGSVAIKVGPIAFTYRGTVTFREKDPVARRIVLDARSRDERGGSTANATVVVMLRPVDTDATDVRVETDLDITGKPAQFGSGVLGEVGNRVIGQFADRLGEEIRSRGPSGGEVALAAPPVADESVRPPADALPVLSLVGSVLGRQAGQRLGGVLVGVIAGVLVGALIGWRRGRSMRRGCEHAVWIYVPDNG